MLVPVTTGCFSRILKAWSGEDEIILVDDASMDRTCNEVCALIDPRLLLIRHSENQGVLRTFEWGLSRSSGEIVFLSDQDYLWLPNKVETVLGTFARHPEVMLVASDDPNRRR